MGHDELSRRLAELADAAPQHPVADRRAAVRRRARTTRRRQAAGGLVGGVAAVALLAPLAGLLPSRGVDPLPPATAPSPGERVLATFTFPSQSAVAELVVPAVPVRPGVEQEVVVRVRTERGRVGGVDLTWGDGTAKYLDGQPRCTPDAGPTVVELRARHAWSAAGTFSVRAAPQVITGCDDGAGRFTVAGATAATHPVQVEAP